MRREFSVEDGFQIVMIFLTRFWETIIQAKNDRKGTDKFGRTNL